MFGKDLKDRNFIDRQVSERDAFAWDDVRFCSVPRPHPDLPSRILDAASQDPYV